METSTFSECLASNIVSISRCPSEGTNILILFKRRKLRLEERSLCEDTQLVETRTPAVTGHLPGLPLRVRRQLARCGAEVRRLEKL